MNQLLSPIQIFPELVEQFKTKLHMSTSDKMLSQAFHSFDPTLMVNLSISINTPNYSSSYQANGYSGFLNEDAYEAINRTYSNLVVPYIKAADLYSAVELDSDAGVPNALYGTPDIHIHPDQILIRCSVHTMLPIVMGLILHLGDQVRFVDLQHLSHAIPPGSEIVAFERQKRILTDYIYEHLSTSNKSKYVLVDNVHYSTMNLFGTRDSGAQSDVGIKSIQAAFGELFSELKQSILDSAMVVSAQSGSQIGYRLVNKTEFKKLDLSTRHNALSSSDFVVTHFI